MGTSKYGIEYLGSASAQPEVNVNAAHDLIDVLVQSFAVSVTNTPPGSPVDGDTYIAGTSPTGVWTGRANNLESYKSGIWQDIIPRPGMMVYLTGVNKYWYWNGTAWGDTGII